MNYPDIYFEPEYARLYETAKSKAFEYRFECKYGVVTNLFLKREIDIPIDDGVQYYDIVTPYGYGGPVIHSSSNKEKLIELYMDDFQEYVSRENIISEFVRFHPILRNASDFQSIYRVTFDRKTVGTNLTYEDVIGTEFSKQKRKEIRKILKNPNIHYEICENPKHIDDFLEVYYSTMMRDCADDYYFFASDYFQKMMKKFPDNIITGKVFLNDKLIGMGLYFRYRKYLHAHLSGSLSEYLEYSPACILKYALALYGHEKTYDIIHYGGGSTSLPDNSLFRFKKQFGLNTEFDFYIAKKIWNEKIYNKMCDTVGICKDVDFFPAYRNKR